MTAAEVEKAIGIPAPTLYRLAQKGEVRYVDASKPWHKQRHYLFRLDDVRADLEKRAKRRPS